MDPNELVRQLDPDPGHALAVIAARQNGHCDAETEEEGDGFGATTGKVNGTRRGRDSLNTNMSKVKLRNEGEAFSPRSRISCISWPWPVLKSVLYRTLGHP